MPTSYGSAVVLISIYCVGPLTSPAGPTKTVMKLRSWCLGEMHMIHIPIFCPSLAMTHSYHLKERL